MRTTRDRGTGPQAEAMLQVVAGPDAGRSVAVGRDGVVIGRGPQAAFPLDDDALISHRHAVIRPAPDGGCTISDLGSANGTFVNGVRIDGPVAVTPADVIGLGETKLRVCAARDQATLLQDRLADPAQAAVTADDPWERWAEQAFAGRPDLIKAAAGAAAAAIAAGATTEQAATAAWAAARAASDAQARSAWTTWARQVYPDDQDRITAAVGAALEAIAAGATTEQAASAARAAAGAAAVPQAAVRPRPHRAAGSDGAARPDDRPGLLHGHVTGFQQRYETAGRRQVSVWDFQLDRSGSAAAAGPVAVEMRGYGFSGALRDGDEVEIDGHARPGKLVRARRVRNLTSHSVVRARGHLLLGRIASLIIVVVFLLVIAAVAVYVISNIRGNS